MAVPNAKFLAILCNYAWSIKNLRQKILEFKVRLYFLSPLKQGNAEGYVSGKVLESLLYFDFGIISCLEFECRL